MTKEGIATTNFEKFRRDIQVEDLYYFLRKVLEKSGWKIRLGDGMLNAYSAIHPLTEGEMEYLKIRLIYPEKFWKTANSYYCTNKAWISVKNIIKDGDFKIADNNLLKTHFLNVALKHNMETRKFRPIKIEQRAHIDGFVSVIDAMTVRQKYWEECGELLKNAA